MCKLIETAKFWCTWLCCVIALCWSTPTSTHPVLVASNYVLVLWCLSSRGGRLRLRPTSRGVRPRFYSTFVVFHFRYVLSFRCVRLLCSTLLHYVVCRRSYLVVVICDFAVLYPLVSNRDYALVQRGNYLEMNCLSCFNVWNS